MTDTAGPFDGSPWAEAQWARHAGVWAPSGVYGAPASSTTTGDLPLSVSSRSVGLGAGRAWVRGFGFERTGSAVMQDPGANTHASFFRRDRIVLRRNLATHTITQVVIQGTPSGSPAAPDLTRSETGSWDLPMFSFLVPPSSGTSISGIVDERAWIQPDSPHVAFPSTAGRDAYYPAPAAGQTCLIGGRTYVWNPALGTSGLWDQVGGPPEIYTMESLTSAYKLIPAGGTYRPLEICKFGRQCWFEGQIMQNGSTAVGVNTPSQFGTVPAAVTPSLGAQSPVVFYTGSGTVFAAAMGLVLADRTASLSATAASGGPWTFDLTGLRWRTDK